jgi:hypothetical protein
VLITRTACIAPSRHHSIATHPAAVTRRAQSARLGHRCGLAPEAIWPSGPPSFYDRRFPGGSRQRGFLLDTLWQKRKRPAGSRQLPDGVGHENPGNDHDAAQPRPSGQRLDEATAIRPHRRRFVPSKAPVFGAEGSARRMSPFPRRVAGWEHHGPFDAPHRTCRQRIRDIERSRATRFSFRGCLESHDPLTRSRAEVSRECR